MARRLNRETVTKNFHFPDLWMEVEDAVATVRAIEALGVLPPIAEAMSFEVYPEPKGYHEPAAKPESLTGLLEAGGFGFYTEWTAEDDPKLTCRLHVQRWRNRVMLAWPRRYFELPEMVAFLEQVPFLWMLAGTLGPMSIPDLPDYRFPPSGFSPGWACAFKGKGHQHVVSRRWLDYGPWRLVRGENDLSLVVFQDIDELDPMVVRDQLVPGHHWMAEKDTRGFVTGSPFRFSPDLQWTAYSGKTKTLIAVVDGREVPLKELTEACHIRLQQPMEHPVERIAYVFMREAEAKKVLFDCWLRDIEVRIIDQDGREVRIDQDFVPPKPEVPEWVQRVRAREGF